MSLDLLESWNKKKQPQEEQQKNPDDMNFKEQIEQMYGYDEKDKQYEETLMKKFMNTVETMRQKRAEQMRKMID
jgi:hypothetical protein